MPIRTFIHHPETITLHCLTLLGTRELPDLQSEESILLEPDYTKVADSLVVQIPKWLPQRPFITLKPALNPPPVLALTTPKLNFVRRVMLDPPSDIYLLRHIKLPGLYLVYILIPHSATYPEGGDAFSKADAAAEDALEKLGSQDGEDIYYKTLYAHLMANFHVTVINYTRGESEYYIKHEGVDSVLYNFSYLPPP